MNTTNISHSLAPDEDSVTRDPIPASLPASVLCHRGVRVYENHLDDFMREFRAEQRLAADTHAKQFVRQFPHANKESYAAALDAMARITFAYGMVGDKLPEMIREHTHDGDALFTPNGFDRLPRAFFGAQFGIPAFDHASTPAQLAARYTRAHRTYNEARALASTMYDELLKLNNVTNPNVTFLRRTLSAVPVTLHALAADMYVAGAPMRETLRAEEKELRAQSAERKYAL